MPDEDPHHRSQLRWIDLAAGVASYAWRYPIWLAWRMLHWRRHRGPGTPEPSQAATTVEVPVSSLVDLAVEAWRLERWMAELGGGASNAAGRFVARRLGAFLSGLGLETVDLTGHRYEPGLALELIGNVSDGTLPPDTVLVDEMVSPLCFWHGKVVRHGQVVTRSSPMLTSLGEQS
jgi:hypothetical protein